MEESRSTHSPHGHRARPLAGGLSLLLLIAIAAATPAEGFGPLLSELAGHGGHDRGALRMWSGRIVQAVRSARQVATRSTAVRPARPWDEDSPAARRAILPAAVADGAGPPLLLRVERHNLPPPAVA